MDSLQKRTVFKELTNGFHYRIPATVMTKAGTMLAFCEARAARADQSHNKMVLKRSNDGGKTWEAMHIIADSGQDHLNNPCVVVTDTGRILLMYQKYPAECSEKSGIVPGYEGSRVVHSYLSMSDDDGHTWLQPQEITRQVKRPHKVTTIASGPGIGIQLQTGPFKGRIIFPFNQGQWGTWDRYKNTLAILLRSLIPGLSFGINIWRVYAVYSDDDGTTWQYGNLAPEADRGHGNEVQMAELSDGSVILNTRSAFGQKYRKGAVSRDGGGTWSGLRDIPQQPEPQCMGSLIRWNDLLLVSHPCDQSARQHGVMTISSDDGRHWTRSLTIHKGFFAYSCLTELPDGDVACFYETGEKSPYERIDWAIIPRTIMLH